MNDIVTANTADAANATAIANAKAYANVTNVHIC